MAPTYFSTTRESCWSLIRWLPLKFIFLIFGSFAANSTDLSVATGFTVDVVAALEDVSVCASVFTVGVPAKGASSWVGACVCKGGTFITAGVAERIGNCTQLSLGLGA